MRHVRPILSIWQQRDSDNYLFHMVAERAPEEVNQLLRRWMELARRLGEMRSG